MTTCKKCGKEIYFILIPVDKDSISVADRITMDNGKDVLFIFGEHISHFATCKFAGTFRKK